MPDEPKARVLELISRHGFNATAFQTLEGGYSYYFPDDDACIAYVDTGSAWVVAGAPIAPHERIASVASDFAARARRAGRRCCFFATEERLQNAARAELRSLRLGEQPIWDPARWVERLKEHRSLREQLRRARAKGVGVRLLTSEDLASFEIRRALTRIVERWLRTKGMAPLAFLVQIELFSFPEHRRLFVAELGGAIVAFAGLVPVPARSGWFLEDLVRTPEAPNGTSELLVDAAMRWSAETGCSWLTLGLAPLAGDVARPLVATRKSTALLYDFEGLRSFKAKLHPDSWSPIYLSYPSTQGAFISLFDALLAFTRGGFLRFGMRSLLRGPSSIVQALTVLLMPWTLLLSLSPVERWFPSPWVKWAWAAFDVALIIGLLRILKRPTSSSLTALATAVTLDATLTLVQAAVFNLERARSPLDYLVVAVACTGPLLAALVLWGARRGRLLSR